MPDGIQIPGGPVFIGFPQPADVPCDPTGSGWRGPPGPAGPQGIPGIDGDVISGGPFLPLTGGHVTGKLQVGATGWLEPIIGGTEGIADFVSLSTNAGSAGVFGTRTSDGGSTGGEGAWGLGGFAINDNTSAVQNAWGIYLESRRNPNTGITTAAEFCVVNHGDTKQSQPYYMGQTGSTIGLWVGAGRDDASPNNNPSLAIGINGGSAIWDRGIMFNWNSVAAGPNGSVAIAMPPEYSLVWYINDGGASQGVGVPGAFIRSDATSVSGLAHPPALVFGNGSLAFDPGNNVDAAVFQVGQNIFQPTTINGLALINGDVSIESGGTEHIRLTSSNGNIAASGSLTISGAAGMASLSVSGNVGFHGATPIAKPNMTGAKGGNTALASVIALLAAYGLGTDSTTA